MYEETKIIQNKDNYNRAYKLAEQIKNIRHHKKVMAFLRNKAIKRATQEDISKQFEETIS